ncbi:Hypothetical predicted protein [Podarcis lilfordi]|uniref:Uncharacterized protein n=1 Tax=Podarcis lilfordi TaxID=74358 RepID=A0AA35LG93_9SAUR|nr:Hypothetical predicted protein [Podarcis lilfordi]
MYCQFADIEERLLERFIGCVRDSSLHCKLLAKDDITMMEAISNDTKLAGHTGWLCTLHCDAFVLRQLPHPLCCRGPTVFQETKSRGSP